MLGCLPVRDAPAWYEVWFDSPYYAILYGNRDRSEADAFIHRLATRLRAHPPASALDVACGTGRHAVVMARLGYNVLGIDLSPASIAIAQRLTRPNLSFQVLDMRQIPWHDRFHVALNLFTSFGYFGAEADERRVLAGIYRALKPGGEIVIDFLNAERTVAELVPFEQVNRGGISFNITRRFNDGTIIKTIDIDDPERLPAAPHLSFEERVRALDADTLSGYLQDTGFEIKCCYGGYALSSYQPSRSDRLILLARKPAP